MTSALLRAHTRVTLPDPQEALNVLSKFYVDNDCAVTFEGSDHVISVGLGTMRVGQQENGLTIEITAANDTAISQLKTGVITMVDQLVPGADLDCRWQGAGQGDAKSGKLPNFRELRVASVCDLGPDMRRLRLTGDDLAPYLGGAIHVRLLVPPHGDDAPEWPTMGENGLPVWPQGDKKVEPRVYTIRQINADEGWMDIDFVVHGDNGPGSRFANHAAPGQLLGVTGPIGNDLTNADWYLFAADETGMPAICRYLEELPAEKKGQVIFEVSGPQAKIDIPHHAGFDIGWVFRDGSAPEGTVMQSAQSAAASSEMPNAKGDAKTDEGGISPFAKAVCDVRLPDDGRSIFCWTATEAATYRHLHKHFRKSGKLGRDECLVMTFWRAVKH
ncbi:siderophore-interacting protein [Thalassospira marina]|uniref:Siderophore-interacting protein n=1 Tax=Thalassospira marina TaxID=2048283 RepID=A0A2N3KBN7_9PROT|nr:siderophore-interacting protein [Thalassospira marina]PKR47982.1 siderophore-interacting protein [Thalassospira marina]